MKSSHREKIRAATKARMADPAQRQRLAERQRLHRAKQLTDRRLAEMLVDHLAQPHAAPAATSEPEEPPVVFTITP